MKYLSPPGADGDHHDLYENSSNGLDKLHLISHELMALEPSKRVVNPNHASFFFIIIPPSFLHPPIQPILNTFFHLQQPAHTDEKNIPPCVRLLSITLGVVNNQQMFF